ncbi:hypothetical protein DC28_07405 [Spirochaeta lutea]|uniref:Uncharacterized protein n=2 Tax=Spirochaeta lutea TaxID=1480694 RepID=A0A098QXN0_9SPIO|nr:hypothetical protein DC28_07405 [Spirochaeta lutea]
MDNQELFPGELSSFGIRPYGVIHPGDDLLLRFEVAGSISSQVEGTTVTTAQDEMIAIIDHKALWRANLYIAETGGDGDWNNLYPWNAPPAAGIEPDGGTPWWWSAEYGVNEWQESQAYDTQAGTPAGGQVIEFSGFSSIRSEGRTDRVAYDYPILYGNPQKWHGAVNTPIEFQQHMESQRDAIGEWFGELGLNNPAPAGLTNQQQQQLGTWNQTTAPADDWRNYVPASWGSFPSAVNNLNNRPYLPGLGLVTTAYNNNMKISADQASAIAADMVNGETLRWAQLMAGVDCIGFAQRVFDYSKDPYTWNTLGPEGAYRTYPWIAADATLKNGRGTHSELIVGKVGEGDIDVSVYRLIKPGDVLYTLNDENEGRHIAIVQDVKRNLDGSVSAGDIRLIEATFWGTTAFVVNPGMGVSRTLQSYENDTWRIIRLKAMGAN